MPRDPKILEANISIIISVREHMGYIAYLKKRRNKRKKKKIKKGKIQRA